MSNATMSKTVPSASRFMHVRGRKYHLRTWGDARAPVLFLLHGAMDTSASFQFVVDHLPAGCCYVAPDWCGSGQSEQSYCHWFPDYVADLDAILEALSPGKAANLIGHSRGGNVACLYAGARPDRVERVMSIEGIGFSLATGAPDEGVTTFAAWLDQQRDRRAPKAYDSIDSIADSLKRNNPRLSAEHARFLARESSRVGGDGKVRLTTVFFPREKEGVPLALPQAMAYWKRISAKVCYVSGALSQFTKRATDDPADFARRKACFANWSEVEIPDAGHMVQCDQPERAAREIVRFFELDAGMGKRAFAATASVGQSQ